MATGAERIGLGAVLALVAAFIVSFARGLGTGAGDQIPADPVVPQHSTPEPSAVVRGTVEVLNAAGMTGLARRATRELRDAGFDVVYYGNAPASIGDSSVVIDRGGALDIARAAAASLGIPRVWTDPDSGLFVDATVIVGVDWSAAEPSGPTDPNERP